MSYSVQNIRNVCLVGHSGNGKTALAESLLFMTGAIDRMGRVADGNTVCDYDPEEVKRQISLSTAVAPIDYKGCRINVLDTPGAFDFSGEVMEALRAADAAIIVASAKDGVSVGVEKAWKYCEERNMPRFIYISKIDEDHSDYNATFDALRERFGNKIAPVVVPTLDENKKVTGLMDILNKRAYEMQDGKRVEIELPEDKVAVINEFNDALKESVAETSEEFMERFFNGDKSNDNARANARGFQPVQHRKWSDLPANYSKTPAADGDKWECNDFFGGDIAGITKKLDYLKGLGVTAIYVNPIYDASSNHRYDAVDYGTIDPFLGNFKDLEKLSAEMQKRGMHLIMDGVYNHIGDDSIYFDRYGKYKTVGAYEYWSRIYDLMNDKHMTEAAAKVEAKKELEAEGQVFSPWHWENWFDIRNEKTQDMMGKKYAYHDWQGYDSLVPFKDADYPGSEQGTVKSDLGDYLLYGNGKDKGVIMKWFDEGLDGWRLDVAKEVPPGFWANVRKEVKSIKTKDGSEPLLLGEIWQDGSQFFTGDTFDSVMNYKLSFALGDLFLNKGDVKAADYELTVLRQNYPKEAFYDLMNIVDSHDTVRAIYKFGGGSDSVAQPTKKDFDYNLGKARLKLAATFLMGYPGMPTIYYGDEAGQYGSGDPDCRRTYPWGKEDKDLIAHYKKVIGVRNAYKDIFARGDVNTLKAEGDIYAFSRKADFGKLGIVALNRGKAQQVTLLVSAADGAIFTDELTSTKATANGGQLTLALGENQGMMLVED